MSISFGAVTVTPSTLVTGQAHAVQCAITFVGEPTDDYSFHVEIQSKDAGGSWVNCNGRVLFDTNDGDGVGIGGFQGAQAYATITMVDMSGTRTVNLNLSMYFDNNTSQPPGTYHQYRFRVRVFNGQQQEVALGNWATYSTGFSLNRYNYFAVPTSFSNTWDHTAFEEPEIQFKVDSFPTWQRLFVIYQCEYFNQVTQQWQACDAQHPVVWYADFSDDFIEGGQPNDSGFTGLYALDSTTQECYGKPRIAFPAVGSYRARAILHPKLTGSPTMFMRYLLFDIISFVSDWKYFNVV